VVRRVLGPIALAAMFAFACSSSSSTTDTTPATDPGSVEDTALPGDDVPALDVERDAPADDVPVATDVPTDVPLEITPECAAITPNTGAINTLTVAGVARRFLLSVPNGATGPGGKWPLVFLWHGFVGASTPDSMEATQAPLFHNQIMGPAVNDARMPFLLVTPYADGSAFMDWNITPSDVSQPNPDVQFFDAVLACLEAKYGVDPDHIHSVGFSAGGIMSDLLGVTRGDRIASVLTWSGAYLGAPANYDETFPIYWPDPVPSSGYVQVAFHGGVADQWSMGAMFTARFNVWNENDVPWLNGLGHDVILCPHTKGHDLPPGYSPAAYVIDFFKAHPRGTTTSPFAAGLPASFPTYCVYHAKTN
jgi:poly(3-hydroxybutyrate) depolymerase